MARGLLIRGMAQSELTQLKELHERMQATVDDIGRIRDEASAVSDELSARRRDVLIQLESLRERAARFDS
jgi:dsDNA-specific endonuclease/ATPase MutS2